MLYIELGVLCATSINYIWIRAIQPNRPLMRVLLVLRVGIWGEFCKLIR